LFPNFGSAPKNNTMARKKPLEENANRINPTFRMNTNGISNKNGATNIKTIEEFFRRTYYLQHSRLHLLVSKIHLVFAPSVPEYLNLGNPQNF
jgi:hypothetical protein